VESVVDAEDINSHLIAMDNGQTLQMLSQEPKKVSEALSKPDDSEWLNAMSEEMVTLCQCLGLREIARWSKMLRSTVQT